MTSPLADRLPPYSNEDAGEEIRACAIAVVRRHPRLAVFPVISTSAMCVLFAYFTSVWGGRGDPDLPAVMRWFDPDQFRVHVFAGACFYLLSMFVATVINVAFYHEAMAVFAGGRPSLSRGLAFAGRRLGPILAWTAFAGTVGILINGLSRKIPFVGRIVLSVIGIAWSIAAVFSIPILVRDGRGDPIQVLRTSGKLVRQTWGELVYGFLNFWFAPAGLIALWVLAICLIIPGVVLPFAAKHQPFPFWTNFVFAGIVAIGLLISFIAGLLRHTYVCALYIYATEGVIPAPFTPALMNAAWKVRAD